MDEFRTPEKQSFIYKIRGWERFWDQPETPQIAYESRLL